MPSSSTDRESVRLPVRPFLYTLDQIGTLLNMTETALKRKRYLFFQNRTPGVWSRDEILTINIAPATDAPEWRVEERELIRWMKRKGFTVID